jgi:hypothetical protein
MSRATSSSGSRRGRSRRRSARTATRMRVLFQHGNDPQVGDKPLGPIETLSEDARGGYYEVPLLDTRTTATCSPASRRASTARRSGSA